MKGNDGWQQLFDQVRIHDAELAALGDASRLSEATLTQVSERAFTELVAAFQRLLAVR